MELSPYLFFSGNCEAALKFYEENLGAKIEAIMKHAGSPMEEHVPAEWRDKVMHAKFKIGDSTVMASDAPPDHYAKPQGFSLAISAKGVAQGEEIFNKLAAGGSVQLPVGTNVLGQGFRYVYRSLRYRVDG